MLITEGGERENGIKAAQHCIIVATQSPIVCSRVKPIFSCSLSLFFFLPVHFLARINMLKPIELHYAVSDVVLQQEAHV